MHVGEGSLRVWVAGCATGEEAYSIGMLLIEEASRREVKPTIQIFGTDLDAGALATAREGRYPSSIAADVSEDRLRRFFVKEGDHYRVRRELRDLVLFASPIARGGLLAAASMAKFAPLPLVPLYAAGGRGIRLRSRDDRRVSLRPLVLFALSLLFFAGLLLAYPAVDPGLSQFWERTVQSQLDRDSPFSIWGIYDLGPLQTIAKAGLVALGVIVAFFPWRRTLIQIAALSAALIIAVELVLEHWFYLYIPWFLGAMLLAMVARDADDVSADTPIR